MIKNLTVIDTINEDIKNLLPTTYNILNESNLIVHPSVYKIILSGSRGLSNCFRENSDIDLSLLVNSQFLNAESNPEKLLQEVLNVTLMNWKSKVELDTVAVFDINNCNLKCFNYESYPDKLCKMGHIDCLGLYKTQKGFHGYIPKIGINIKLIYPIITVWARKR